jgi:hypothetical protein
MNQVAILSNVISRETDDVIDKGKTGIVNHVAMGRVSAPLIGQEQLFLRGTVEQATKILDVRRDCGAAGDGRWDDTKAIQRCFDRAHMEREDTAVYFPTATYRVSKTLQVLPGAHYRIEGTGWFSRIVWKGDANGTVLHIHDPAGLSLERLALGGPDGTTTILQTGSIPGHVRYSNVFGYYDDETREERIVFDRLPAGTLVVADHLDGRITIRDSSQASILLGFLVSGQMIVEGASPASGFLGVLSRASALETFPLVIRDNQSLIMSDWYNEQTAHLLSLQGHSNQRGQVIIDHTEARVEDLLLTRIEGYHGLLVQIGGMFGLPSDKKARKIEVNTAADTDIVMVGNMYWHTLQQVDDPSTSMVLLGNSLNRRELGPFSLVENQIDEQGDHAIGIALDAFRLLGTYDLGLNYCITP